MAVPMRSNATNTGFGDDYDPSLSRLRDYYGVLTEAAEAARLEYRAIRRAGAQAAYLWPVERHWQLLEQQRALLAQQLGLAED